MDKCMYVYSKKTGNLLIQLENFGNVFVYWTWCPMPSDKKLYNDLGYDGHEEISKQEGKEMIDFLENHKSVSIDYSSTWNA